MTTGPRDDATRFGLCATCAFGRLFRSGKDATYVTCDLSRTDPAYPRFPSIPVIRCRGFEDRGEDPGKSPNVVT